MYRLRRDHGDDRSSAPVRSPRDPLPAAAIASSRAFRPGSTGRSNRRVMKRRIDVVSYGV